MARTGPIVVAGASGYVGRALCEELVAHDYTVLALVRRPSDALPIECQQVVVTDFSQPVLVQALAGAHPAAVVSCLASRSGEPADAWRIDHAANEALLDAALCVGAGHFQLLSALCVQKPQLEFQHAKLAFEDTLSRSAVAWTIIRPTAFFKSLSGQVERIRNGKPFLVFGDGTETACKPISTQDLAAFMRDCMEDPGCHRRILPIGGPGPALTPRAMGELLFDLTGQTPRFKSVPPGLFKILAAVMTPLAKVSRRLAAKAELLRIAHFYATESMLVWDPEAQRYDAAATPESGTDTLASHYRMLLANPAKNHQLGQHKLF
ncbi:MAG: NAD(P)H-binding protein [Pseudomonadota bacterium]